MSQSKQLQVEQDWNQHIQSKIDGYFRGFKREKALRLLHQGDDYYDQKQEKKGSCFGAMSRSANRFTILRAR